MGIAKALFRVPFFSGSTRGKARSGASQLTNVCCLCHRRKKGKEGKRNKGITHLKWLDSKTLPLPSGFFWVTVTLVFRVAPLPLSPMEDLKQLPHRSPQGKKRGNVLFERKGVTRKKERKEKLLFSSLIYSPRCPIGSFFLTAIFQLVIIKVTGQGSTRLTMFMHSN